MDFTQTVEALRASERDVVAVSEEWAQGRALFGGLAAALVMAPMMRKVPGERVLRCMNLTFIGPVAPGQVAITSRLLREGRNVSHGQAEAVQRGSVRTTATASFGLSRPSSVAMEATAAPETPSPEEVEPILYREGVSPSFTRFFDYRYCIGSTPFSGARTRQMGGWIRFIGDSGAVGPLQLLGLVDAWPPATLPLLDRPVPSSSLSWFVEFVQPLPAIEPGAWLLYEATLDHARDGYGQTQARLWTRHGQLIVISRQTVTVFD